MNFRLLAFGGLSLREGTSTVQLLGRVQLALLARLAVAGERGVRRDQILSLFWPESDDVRARGSLKQAMYGIRQGLRDANVILGTDQLRLNPQVLSSDVADFQRALHEGELDGAVERYVAPFLEGFHIGNGEFARWRDEEADRLALSFRQALTTLARAAEGRDQLDKAIPLWRRLAREDPLSAKNAASLITALARSGDATSALKEARAHEQAVFAELGTAPDPSIQALTKALEREIAEAASLTSNVDNGDSRRVGSPAATAGRAVGTTPPRPAMGIAAGVALAGTLLFVATTTGRRTELVDHGVAFAGGRADTQTVTAIGRLLSHLDTSLVVLDGTDERARFSLAVGLLELKDSLRLDVTIQDRRRTQVAFAIAPVVVASEARDAALIAAAERLAVLLAANRAGHFASWANAAALPHSWEAFRALSAAIQSWTLPDLTAPLAHLDSAARLEPTSATPIVWKALVLGKLRQRSASDSALALAASLRRGLWDDAVMEVLRYWNRGDITSAHAAGHRLLDIVPRSEWAILPAYDALTLGRVQEAIDLFAQVPTGIVWTQWWGLIGNAQAHHLLKDHETEARIARAALEREPDRSLARQVLTAALVGMGSVAEAEKLCFDAMHMPSPNGYPWQPCNQLMVELWAHGHRDAARAVAQRYLAMIETEPMTPDQKALERATTFADIGHWEEAAAALLEIRNPEAHDEQFLRYSALVNAARRDTQALSITLVKLRAKGAKPDPLFDAGLAALLGDRARAVNWLQRAFRAGQRNRTLLHWHAPFESLHGYAPFDELTRPVEDQGHRARMARRAGS